MIFDVCDVEQGSEAWLKLRLGRLTSTCADGLLATRQDGKEAAGRKNLLMKLALEQITGRQNDRAIKTPAMQYGSDMEAEAFAVYEAMTGNLLMRSGFLKHRELMAGTSLDGHAHDFSMFCELKNPEPAQHMDYLLSGLVPLEYYRQCLHHFWLVPQAASCDWMSYCADFPKGSQTKLVTINRDGLAPIYTKKGDPKRKVADDLEEYDKKARALLIEVDAMVNTIKTLGNLTGQLEASLAV